MRVQGEEERELVHALTGLRGRMSRGGNISGGGESNAEWIPLKRLDASTKGADLLRRYQLSLVGISEETAQSGGRVVLIDSGVMPESQAARNVVLFKDFTGTCGLEKMCDESQHGTIVADLILQAAPKAEVIALKVLSGGSGGSFTNILQALKWVHAHARRENIRVINLSLTSVDNLSGSWDQIDEAKELVKKLKEMKLILVTAAGNDYQNSMAVFPANSPDVITVGSYNHFFSTDRTEFRASGFSNSGYADNPTVKHRSFLGFSSTERNFNAWIFKPDVLAPGEMLLSCAVECYLVTGTSFAAGLVSGGIFGALGRQPGLTQEKMMERTRSACPQPVLPGSPGESRACSFDYRALFD